MIGGKVMMDRNAPKELLDTPEKAYNDTKKLPRFQSAFLIDKNQFDIWLYNKIKND